MKKILMILVCCMVLVGCSNKNIEEVTDSTYSETKEKETEQIERSDLYQTDEIIDGVFEEIEYSIPKTWNDGLSEIEDGIRFDSDDLSIVICTKGYWNAYNKKYNELTSDEQETELKQTLMDCSNEFTNGSHDSYRIKRTENMEISDYVSDRFKVEIVKDEKSFFYDSAIICENSKFYIFSMWTKSENEKKYSKDFNNFLNSISIYKNLETAFSEYKASIIEISKEIPKSDYATDEQLKKYVESYKVVSEMSQNNWKDNQNFNDFCLASGYFYNNFENTTNGNLLGVRGLLLIEYVVTGEGDKERIVESIESVLESMNFIEHTEESLNQDENISEFRESIELSTGKYTVGDDIPSGKYDIVGIKGGNVRVCSPGKDYGDILSEIIEAGETVYSNVRLENGQTLEIVNGGKIQLQPK